MALAGMRLSGVPGRGAGGRGVGGRTLARPAPLPLSESLVRSQLRFAGVTLFACLILQRFALPAGSFKISLATPIMVAVAGWMLLQGRLRFDRVRLGLMLGLIAVAIMATAVHINVPLAIAPRISQASLAYWLLVTSFATLSFAVPVPEDRFFRLVSWFLLFIAIAGLLAFVAQFAHLTLFSFKGFVPGSLLIEEQYAVEIPMQHSERLRANGFFLVEPSVFSQYMSLGFMIEAVFFRRKWALALFVVALLSSVSGTGWLVMAAFVVQLAIGSGTRGLKAAIGLLLGLVTAFGVLYLVLPDVAQGFLWRFSEFGMKGTSGNERFVTPFLALGDVLARAPYALFTGIGPGSSEQMDLPYFYTVNTPIKVLMEYGMLGLGLYVSILAVARRTRRQTMLVLAALVMLLLGGGYQQFSPVVFSVVLLICVARLSPTEPPTPTRR